MILTKNVMIQQSQVETIICDICKKQFDIEKDWMETQEFLHIHLIGGYGSILGDESNVRCDICQHCLQDKLGKYLRFTED